MSERYPTSVDSAVIGVESSLSLARNGMPEEALFKLEEMELSIGNLSARVDYSETDTDRHFLYWLFLVRATLLIDLGRLSDAKRLLELVLETAGASEKHCQRGEATCFLGEIVRTSMILARTKGYEGMFNSSIEISMRAIRTILESSHEGFDQHLVELAKQIDEYGEALGYDELSTKIGTRPEKRNNGEVARSRAGWKYPIALNGSFVEEFKRRYNSLRRTIFDVDTVSPTIRRARLLEALEVVDEWRNSVPYSIEARSIQLELKLALAAAEVETDMFENFDNLFSEIDRDIETFLLEAPEMSDARREIAVWLYSLSRAILIHQFENAETRTQFFLLSARCLSAAYEMLEHLRSVGPVTQAVALNACSVSHLVAKSNEMIGQNELAESHRLRRDRILSEVLRRDPRNDRATKLKGLYGVGHPETQPSRHSEISDISSWTWSIEPLV
jgi:hypothetical protein